MYSCLICSQTVLHTECLLKPQSKPAQTEGCLVTAYSFNYIYIVLFYNYIISYITLYY